MKNAKPFNSLSNHKEDIINAHMRKDVKRRRQQFHQESTPWLAFAVLAAIAVAIEIIYVEYLFSV